MFFVNDGLRGRGSTPALSVLFDWPDGSATGDADRTAWPYVQGWRPEERAMICSCLAADGERSKRDEADGGVAATDGGPRCDWPV